MKKAKYFSLNSAHFKLDGGAMFGIIPKPLWSRKAPADEQNRITLALRSMVIQVGQRVILFDTGIGDYHNDKFKEQFAIVSGTHPLEQSLAKIGLKCSEVTDLVIGHLHFDHVGGLVSQKNGSFIPNFPNATYHLHQKHFEYAKCPTERDAGSFISKTFYDEILRKDNEKKVHWCHGENGTVLKEGDYELNYVISMGHTPYLLHPFDHEWIYLADLIPTSAHIHIPWVMGYDIHPGVTTEDKRRVLKMVEQENLKVFFEHDPLYYGATIKSEIKNGRQEFSARDLFNEKSEGTFAI